MRETRHWLIPVMVLAVTLGLAGPAMGGVDCNERPDHPQCSGYPTGGFTCDPADYPAGIDGVQTETFSFTLGGSDAYACIDIAAAGPWDITVDGSRARSLTLIGRDSIAPGDACDVYVLRGAEIYGSNPVRLDMPLATINACGVGWAEWVSLDTPGLDPYRHCVDFDDDAGLCLVADMVDVAHPLAFQAFMTGWKDASATIEVQLP